MLHKKPWLSQSQRKTKHKTGSTYEVNRQSKTLNCHWAGTTMVNIRTVLNDWDFRTIKNFRTSSGQLCNFRHFRTAGTREYVNTAQFSSSHVQSELSSFCPLWTRLKLVMSGVIRTRLQWVHSRPVCAMCGPWSWSDRAAGRSPRLSLLHARPACWRTPAATTSSSPVQQVKLGYIIVHSKA